MFLVVGKKDDSSASSLKDNKEDKCDEICLFYVWKYCKHNGKPYMKYLWSVLFAEVLPTQWLRVWWHVECQHLRTGSGNCVFSFVCFVSH